MARTQFTNRQFRYPLSAQGVGINNNRDLWKFTINDLQTLADALDPTATVVNGIVTVSGGLIVPIVSATGNAQLGVASPITYALPDVATANYDLVVPVKLEVIDITVNKQGTGTGNTIQLFNGTGGNAISDAIVAAVDKAVTRVGTLDTAFATLTAGSTLRLTNTKAGASAACKVTVTVVRRA